MAYYMPSAMESTRYGDYTRESLPSRGSTSQLLNKFPLTYPFLTNHLISNSLPSKYNFKSHLQVINNASIVQYYVVQGFPGGAVVKNPPASARDTGSSPGPGRSHIPWSS